MKKQLLTLAAVAGLALSAYSQGSIFVDNSANFGNDSATATTGGTFLVNNGTTITPIATDFNLTVLSSSTQSGTYTAVKTYLASGNGAGGNFLPGLFIAPDGNAVVIPGTVVNGSTFIQLQAWLGTATTYDAAVAAGALTGSTPGFQISALGGIPTTGNPVNPPGLDAMPALVLSAVPEPSSFALAGLGAAALMIFRRRK